MLLTLIAAVSKRARLGAGDKRLVAMCGVFVAAYQAGLFAAVADTGVAAGTVVALGSAPAFTGLFATIFTRERLKRRWFADTGSRARESCSSRSAAVKGRGLGAWNRLALAAGAGYAATPWRASGCWTKARHPRASWQRSSARAR